MFIKIMMLALISFSALGKDKINVIATLPELAWLVQKIGKDQVEVKSLLSGNEDPHYVDATPAFVFKVSRADLVVYNGLFLETGWLPKVIQTSGNSNVQYRSVGNCDAGQDVEKIGVVKNYDRSMGDLHPGGNPHYTLSPKQMIKAAGAIKKCLEKVGGQELDKNLKELVSELDKLAKDAKAKVAKLKNKKFMVYHREFRYLFEDLGLENIGSLEEVPGVLPSAGHLAKVAKLAKEKSPALALASSVSPKKYLEKFKELSDTDFLMLKIHSSKDQSYTEFYNELVSEIIEHAK